MRPAGRGMNRNDSNKTSAAALAAWLAVGATACGDPSSNSHGVVPDGSSSSATESGDSLGTAGGSSTPSGAGGAGTSADGPGNVTMDGVTEGGTATAPGDGNGMADPAFAGDELGPGPSQVPLRRLTNEEYLASISDLFPGFTLPQLDFTPDTAIAGLRNLASSQNSTLVRIEQYDAAARTVAKHVTADPAALTGCDPATTTEAACAEGYIADLGKRAYRRPLEAAEKASLVALFNVNGDTLDYATRLQQVVHAILQSPNFLFRPEFGIPEAGALSLRLTPWELATRLSYFIAGTTPDAELMEAAEAGQLSTADEVSAQAQRLQAQEGSRRNLVDFHRMWLGVERIGIETKDAEVYPDFTPSLATSMGEETRRFLEYVLFDGAGSYRELFTAPYSFVNAELAEFYGVPAPATDWDQVELPATQRAGVLTHGSVMATTAKQDNTDPVHRGKFVLSQMLCTVVQPPPPEVVAMFPPMDLSLTARERFTEHSTNPACAGCHSVLDPVGLAFEHFDGAGAWRDDDRGMPLDVTGEIAGVAIDGAIEVGQVVGDSSEARSCYVTQWFRYGFGRLNVAGSASDDGFLAWLAENFSSDVPITTLIDNFVRSNAFRFKQAGN